jgi:hypothetical protein
VIILNVLNEIRGGLVSFKDAALIGFLAANANGIDGGRRECGGGEEPGGKMIHCDDEMRMR